MKKWIVTYTLDKGGTIQEIDVDGKDYTDAFLNACYKLPKKVIILTVDEKKKNKTCILSGGFKNV